MYVDYGSYLAAATNAKLRHELCRLAMANKFVRSEYKDKFSNSKWSVLVLSVSQHTENDSQYVKKVENGKAFKVFAL